MEYELVNEGKNIYCMSFKWLQTSALRRELLIFESEADIAIRTRPFCLVRDKFEERSWDILKYYDCYGYPAMDRLEILARQKNEVYGCGLKVRFSATEQKTEDGKGYIVPLDYWKNVSTEMYRSDDDDIEVQIGGVPLLAIPYDVPVLDSERKECYRVRLWDAETKYKYDVERLPKEYWRQAVEHMEMSQRIITELLPPQQMRGGKKLCLIQKYFMVSATVQWAVKRHMNQYHNINNFTEKNMFLICDAWSELALPELIRILRDEYGLSIMDATKITEQVCVCLKEEDTGNLFQVWREDVIFDALPNICQILTEMEENKHEGKNN